MFASLATQPDITCVIGLSGRLSAWRACFLSINDFRLLDAFCWPRYLDPPFGVHKWHPKPIAQDCESAHLGRQLPRPNLAILLKLRRGHL
jgi:hypothetical protein